MWGLFAVEQYSSYEVEQHTSHTKLQGIKRKEPESFKTMQPTAEKSKNKSPKPSTFISAKIHSFSHHLVNTEVGVKRASYIVTLLCSREKASLFYVHFLHVKDC